jgi:hypothetical protein
VPAVFGICWLFHKEVDVVTLSMLWLPILISAVLVFFASNVLWMLLPFWHSRDYGRLADEKPILAALTNAKSDQYIVPFMDWKTMTPEQRAEAQKGPAAFMLVRNPSTFSLGKTLGIFFFYQLVVAIFVGYLTGVCRGVGTPSMEVFRVAGTAGFMAFAFRTVPDSIWYGRPWRATFKEMIDGLIYGLLMAATFAWLWPH